MRNSNVDEGFFLVQMWDRVYQIDTVFSSSDDPIKFLFCFDFVALLNSFFLNIKFGFSYFLSV